jgi:predicted enzyme related to lactoylglutathione lyase
MPQPVVHFEIPADNPERLGRFYTDLFGWRVEKWPGPLDYWLLYTRGQGQGPVAIDGGMYRRELPDQRPVNYVHVHSAEEFSEKAKLLGGRVILPRTQVPGVGYVAILVDPEGNPIGLYETRGGAVAAERSAPKTERAPQPRAAGRAPAARKSGPVKKGARPKTRKKASKGGPVKKGARKKRSRR